MKKKFFLVLLGATGTGKTDFSLKLAQNLPLEIINGDIGQMYVPLTIGTAKPDWQNAPVKHHLFDCINEPVNYTVFAYREKLRAVMQDVWQRGNIPLIVGGSGFYIDSIFFPPHANHYNYVPIETGEDKGMALVGLSDEQAWEKLNAIDPVRAAKLHPHDSYRIRRALHIWQVTRQKPSLLKPLFDAPAPAWIFFLDREKDDLYERINKRTVAMLEQGWIEEVQNLLETEWKQFLIEKKFIGYDTIVKYLQNEKSETAYTDLLNSIQKKTRNYAKRQYTFWRMLRKKITLLSETTDNATSFLLPNMLSINLTSVNIDLYIDLYSKQFCDQLKSIS